MSLTSYRAAPPRDLSGAQNVAPKNKRKRILERISPGHRHPPATHSACPTHKTPCQTWGAESVLHPVMRSTPPLRLLLLLAFSLLTTACSGPWYSLKWRAARDAKQPDGALAGAWQGHWRSGADGHHGTLRCIISEEKLQTTASTSTSPAPTGTPYRFHYRATWKHLLSASFRTTQYATRDTDGTWHFSGDQKLPNWAGGTYHHEGTVKGDHLESTFKSAKDHGAFTMDRAQPR